jgi:hypothetical protein
MSDFVFDDLTFTEFLDGRPLDLRMMEEQVVPRSPSMNPKPRSETNLLILPCGISALQCKNLWHTGHLDGDQTVDLEIESRWSHKTQKRELIEKLSYAEWGGRSRTPRKRSDLNLVSARHELRDAPIIGHLVSKKRANGPIPWRETCFDMELSMRRGSSDTTGRIGAILAFLAPAAQISTPSGSGVW